VVALDDTQIFSRLSPTELNALRQIASELSFAPGEQIFKEGDLGDAIYVVKNGTVEISGLLAGDVRRVFSVIGAGDVFGEMAVLEDKPRSACAIARSNTTVYRIPRVQMLKLVESSPALAMALLREISNRLREFNGQYLREVLQTERLAIVGKFARSILHDIKNPLNIISMTAEMTDIRNSTRENRAEVTSRIRKQVERISDLIGEILEFTRTSHTGFVLAAGDYSTFVRQLIEEIRSEISSESATLQLDCPPAIQALFDPKRLRRVFYNLIHNAMDAMPDGGKILIRVRSSGTEVVTEFQDTGTGIPSEMTDKLFEAFATFGKQHGTGLGLSICKRIIDDHRGWISASNLRGGGAVFSFGLPLRSEVQNSSPQARQTRARSNAALQQSP
jgi:signal transduction histidine kinase